MQRFDRETVAGVNAQDGFRMRHGALEFHFDFGCEAIEQRRQTGGYTFIRPNEFLAQCGEFGTAAARGFHEWRAENLLPAAQNAPRIAIRELRTRAGLRQAAVFADAHEKIDETLHHRFAVERVQLPVRANLYFEHYL